VERSAGPLVALLGIAVSLAWVLNVPAPRGGLPGLATMTVDAALSFILSGVAFWFATGAAATRKARVVLVAICSGVTLLVCGDVRSFANDGQRSRGLVATNPLQLERLTKLEELLRQRKGSSLQTADIDRRNGAAAVASLTATERGQELTNRIAAVIDGMERIERGQLAKRERDYGRLTSSTFAILPAGTFLGVSMLLAVLFFLNVEATGLPEADRASRIAAAVWESTDDAIITKTLGGIITGWNPGAERIFGYAASEAIGRSVLIFIPPDRAHEEEAILARIARGERIDHFETVRMGKDGRPVDVSVTVSPLRDQTGRITGASKILRDITERKQAAAALREGEERLRFALETVGVGAWDLDLGNHNAHRTLGHDRIFGYESLQPQWTYEMFLEHVVPEDRDVVERRFHEASATQGDWSFECRIRRADGQLRWIWAAGRHCRDESGQRLRMAGIVQDITDRKRTEQALRESAERFRFLNDLVEATRTLADPDQIMAVMARMLGEHLGASRCAYADVEPDGDQFTIRHDYTDGCASTVGTYRLALFGARAVATLHRGETLIIRSVDAELSSGDGADMFNAIGIKAIITCPLVKDGALRAMMAVHQTSPRDWQSAEIAMVQDVVERCWATIERRAAEDRSHKLNLELEQRVLERTAELQASNKELEAFSYSVSHDLRSPLRTVDGFSQALLEDFGPALPEDGQRFVRTIREAAQRMGALIDDLLAFSRLGRQSLSTRAAVDMDRLVRDALEDLSPDRQGREVEIRVSPLPPGSGDTAMLKQVWVNLLSNAIKYTRKREAAAIEVGAESGSGETVYFVRDNGTGFDMRYAEKLFGVFQRLHRAEDFEGTGVGLAIVQRIVHRHGGRVWAESAPDQGATFHFTLSRGAAA
jgi:PAS domain S-box-containing protein